MHKRLTKCCYWLGLGKTAVLFHLRTDLLPEAAHELEIVIIYHFLPLEMVAICKFVGYTFYRGNLLPINRSDILLTSQNSSMDQLIGHSNKIKQKLSEIFDTNKTTEAIVLGYNCIQSLKSFSNLLRSAWDYMELNCQALIDRGYPIPDQVHIVTNRLK